MASEMDEFFDKEYSYLPIHSVDDYIKFQSHLIKNSNIATNTFYNIEFDTFITIDIESTIKNIPKIDFKKIGKTLIYITDLHIDVHKSDQSQFIDFFSQFNIKIKELSINMPLKLTENAIENMKTFVNKTESEEVAIRKIDKKIVSIHNSTKIILNLEFKKKCLLHFKNFFVQYHKPDVLEVSLLKRKMRINFVKLFFVDRYKSLSKVKFFFADFRSDKEITKLLTNVNFKNKNLELHFGYFEDERGFIELLQKRIFNIGTLKISINLFGKNKKWHQWQFKKVFHNFLTCCTLYKTKSVEVFFYDALDVNSKKYAEKLIEFVNHNKILKVKVE